MIGMERRVSRRLSRAVILGALLPALATASPNTDLQAARRLFESGRYSEASARFRQIAAAYPSAPEAAVAAYYIGLSQERMGDRPAALKSYNDMLAKYGATSDLADFARQRVREVQHDIDRGASGPSRAPSAAPAAGTPPATGAAVDALARNVVSDILDRSLPPSEAPAPRRSSNVSSRNARPSAAPAAASSSVSPTRSASVSPARARDAAEQWPDAAANTTSTATAAAMPTASSRAVPPSAESRFPAVSDNGSRMSARPANSASSSSNAAFPVGASVPSVEFPSVSSSATMIPEAMTPPVSAKPNQTVAAAAPAQAPATPAAAVQPAGAPQQAAPPSVRATSYRAEDGQPSMAPPQPLALPVVQVSRPVEADRVSEPSVQGAYAVSYVRRGRRPATIGAGESIESILASGPAASSARPAAPAAVPAPSIQPVSTSAAEASVAPASTADAVLAEMVPAEVPSLVVIPEAVAPRNVPSPNLVVAPGVRDDFAMGSGVEDGPDAPPVRAQIPPIESVQPVGTVLHSDLFRFRRGSSQSGSQPASTPAKPEATPASTKPEPDAATPQTVEPVLAPVIPAMPVQPTAGAPSRTIDPASEEIRPLEPSAVEPAQMSPDVVESLSATDWSPVDFGIPIAPLAERPATNVTSTPMMPAVSELPAVEMGSVTAPEPAPPADYSAPITSPLGDALRPGGTLLGAPVTAGSPSATSPAVSSAPPVTPVFSPQGAAVTVPAPASSTAAGAAGLPTPLYTISIESLRRDLASEAAAVSPDLTSPSPSVTSGPPASGTPGGPQRLVAGGTPVGGYRQSPADPLISRAVGFRKLGMDEQAITAYREALTLDPRNPIVKNNLSDLLVERGENLEEAVDLMQEALQEDLADRGPYYSTLGWAYTRLGDYSNAEKFLNEALRAGVTAGRLYRRGRLYAAMGMVSRARADLDRALVYSEDAATSEMIRQALTELRTDLPVQGTTRNVR